jgi:hypothetical protein
LRIGAARLLQRAKTGTLGLTGTAGAPMSRYITYGVIVATIAFAIALSLNQGGGPTVDTTGTVEASGYTPSDVGPPLQHATVRLSDGTVVHANVAGAMTVRPGQLAKVRIYRRVLTGGPNYEVVGVEGGAR